MFNHLSYRVAQKTIPNYLYDEIRKGSGVNAEEYMKKYNEYLASTFDMNNPQDKAQAGYASKFVNSLVQNPDVIKNLEQIFHIMSIFVLDINFVKYLYNNFDLALYKYAMNNGLRQGFDLDEEFNELSELEKQDYFLKNKEKFTSKYPQGISSTGIQANFEDLIRQINTIAAKINVNIYYVFDLIEFFNKSESYILPIVYHQRKSHQPYKQSRQVIINSNEFEKILSDYISKDIKSRKDIISKLGRGEDFEKYIFLEHQDLYNYLSSNGFLEEDYMFHLDRVKQHLFKEFINNENFWETKKSDNDRKAKLESKYFSEFNLPNSSYEEKKIFVNLEKLGLHAIPAPQKDNLELLDDDGNKFGFKIDFLLPCNIREYNGENYTLREDVIFIGEYFGFYGEKYDQQKERKKIWQNNFEKSLDQRCLHIDLNTDLCSVLKEKNIDSKCYPDFGGHLFNVEDINQKKTFYVKSQLQNFLYTYLVNELLWQINYNYNFNTMENLNKVKEKNQSYIDRYQKLLDNIREYKAKELVAECMKILEDYKKPFNREKKLGDRSLRLSKTFNNKKTPSIL